jgi:uncharacterized protein with GYD domain
MQRTALRVLPLNRDLGQRYKFTPLQYPIVTQYAGLQFPRARIASKTGHGQEVAVMAFYLTRFSYTPETWARLTKNPEDRRAAARKYIESVGGKLHGFWYAFGAHDGYTLWEAPDNVSMAAVAIAIGSGGALSKIETTPLLTVEETLDALGRARAVAYRPPGA